MKNTNLTRQEIADEIALNLFVGRFIKSENKWRKRIALELCKAYQDGFNDGKTKPFEEKQMRWKLLEKRLSAHDDLVRAAIHDYEKLLLILRFAKDVLRRFNTDPDFEGYAELQQAVDNYENKE